MDATEANTETWQATPLMSPINWGATKHLGASELHLIWVFEYSIALVPIESPVQRDDSREKQIGL
jgi:hypothetical protein